MRSLLLILLPLAAFAAEPVPPSGLAELPVLHQDRVKPLFVAAEEIVTSLCGKPRFGHTEAVGEELKVTPMPPTTLVMELMLHPDDWRSQPLLNVSLLSLREQFGLHGEWMALTGFESPQVKAALAGASMKERRSQTGELVDFSREERAALTLAQRHNEAESVLSGREIALCPLVAQAAQANEIIATISTKLLATQAEIDERPWRAKVRSLARSDKDGKVSIDANALIAADPWLTFEDLVLRPDPLLAEWPNQDILSASARLGDALRANGDVDDAGRQLASALRATLNQQDKYPSAFRLSIENAYHRVHPFAIAWLALLFGGMLTAWGIGRSSHALRRSGIALTSIGILAVSAGLGARAYITSLAAVTNLYETLIYVSLVVAVLGLIFTYTSGKAIYALAAGIGAALCANIGENIPPEFGQQITQLQAVLRTRFWLWIHVKTEVASYAAFLLAWVMGNIVLARAAIEKREVTNEEGRLLYRCLQVGVVLVTAGTLLGAWWADYAWGRFWGWDPKEVGALIILLVYLVPLHLRYAGVVGPTGLAAWSVFGFYSVIWSWYGVNFILGTGKHAYAFGSGGQGIVYTACAIQAVLAVVALVVIRERRRLPTQA